MVKDFAENFSNSKLNLPVKFYKKWLIKIILFKKNEFDRDFSLFWPHFAFAKTYKALGLEFSGNA